MRLCEINNILDATPLIDILNIRKEAQDLLDKNPKFEQRVSNEMLKKIEEYSKKEKELFAVAKIQQEKKCNHRTENGLGSGISADCTPVS